MLQTNIKSTGLLFGAVLVLMFASLYQMNVFKQAYDFSHSFVEKKAKVIVASRTRFVPKVVGPPFEKTEYTEVDMGGGKRKLVVSRGGKKREYQARSEIWREYTDMGGVQSILGSPTSDEYTWFDGKRQDFERGHWLFWSEKTGVKMDYNPYGKESLLETTPQAPIFFQGKPVVEWADLSQDKYFITQDFGKAGHLGQDLGINNNPNPGYEIRPIAAGKVIFAGWAGPNAWGYMVLIKHSLKTGQHYYSQYAHLYDFPQVLAGQQVHKGTILGYVGSTGKSTGPHLDLQIKELLRLEQNAGEINLTDVGTGYTKNRAPFIGSINIDSQKGIIYYKPSYFIENFNNGAVLIGHPE